MPLIGERLEPGTAVADRILSWPGDTTASGDSVPLRLAGALHALKVEGKALVDVYPPNDVEDKSLWAAIEAAFVSHETQLMHWLDSPPQTNEVRRAAVLLPALAVVGKMFGGPVDLLELGTSAGLNLRFDHFRLNLPSGNGIGPHTSKVQITPEWQGTVTSTDLPEVVMRKGVDLNPLDGKEPRDRLRLLAYLWPDQPGRLAATEAALSISNRVSAHVDQGDAATWCAAQLTQTAKERLTVLFHTVAWQYFPKATQAHILDTLKQVTSPVVQIGMEGDGGRGAAVTLTLWPEGRTHHLGRASFHGLWVDWGN